MSIDTRSFADPDSISKHSPEEAASEEGNATDLDKLIERIIFELFLNTLEAAWVVSKILFEPISQWFPTGVHRHTRVP